MNCLHCGFEGTQCNAFFDMPFVVRRVYSCHRCFKKFETFEVSGGIWPTLSKYVSVHGRRITARLALRKRDEKIFELAMQGMRHAHIAEQLGLKDRIVSHVIAKEGLPSLTKVIRATAKINGRSLAHSPGVKKDRARQKIIWGGLITKEK